MTKQRVVSDEKNDVQTLLSAHAQLDRRVRELDRRAFLTPGEQRELADLKKRKLVVKDRIRASQPPPPPRSN
jgi:uncharacterized protein YdcH (DUF465 family)